MRPRMFPPDHADQGFSAFILYIRQLAQVRRNLGQQLVRIHGERNTHFRSRHHVDGTLMPIEDLKDGMQVAMRHQHTAGNEIDDGKAPLNGNRFEGALAVRRHRGDARALVGRIVRVEHQDWDVLFARREEWWPDAGLFAPKYANSAASSKLIVFTLNASGQNPGIGGHDAVHVRPDFNCFGVHRAANECRRKI